MLLKESKLSPQQFWSAEAILTNVLRGNQVIFSIYLKCCCCEYRLSPFHGFSLESIVVRVLRRGVAIKRALRVKLVYFVLCSMLILLYRINLNVVAEIHKQAEVAAWITKDAMKIIEKVWAYSESL